MIEKVLCPECGAPCEFHAELHADRSPGYVYKTADAPPTEEMRSQVERLSQYADQLAEAAGDNAAEVGITMRNVASGLRPIVARLRAALTARKEG